MIYSLFKYYIENPFIFFFISFYNYQFFKIKCTKNMSLTKFKWFFDFLKMQLNNKIGLWNICFDYLTDDNIKVKETYNEIINNIQIK